MGFSDAEPGGERGWKGRHDGWNNVLQQCEWLLGGSGDDDGQYDIFQQLEWLVGGSGDDDGQHDVFLQRKQLASWIGNSDWLVGGDNSDPEVTAERDAC